MDKLLNNFDNKIDEIKKRYKYIQSNYKGEFKRNLVLYDNINIKLNEIDNLLDAYEEDNVNEIKLDELISDRIKENKKFRDMIKYIAPVIINYQMNNI